MELRQFEYFIAVAEEENFTRAAERLSVAQPSVSQQIKKLESEVGERLLHRDRRSVRLTVAGDAFLPHARAVLNSVERARDAVRSLKGLLTGNLTVGFVQTLPDRTLLRLIRDFRKEHPGVEFTLIEDETDALLDRLDSGEIEIALIGLGLDREPPKGTEFLDLAREDLVVALAPSHRLASREAIALSSIRDEPIVTLTKESLLRVYLEAASRSEGFTPRIVAETTDIDFLVRLAEENIGVAVLPRSAVDNRPTVAVVPLIRPTIERRLLLVWTNAQLSPAGRALVELARNLDLPPTSQTPGSDSARDGPQTGIAST